MSKIVHHLLVLGATCLASAGMIVPGLGATEVEDDPFVRPARATPPAPAQASLLDGLELTGIATVGGQTRVCLADITTKRTCWMAVGDAAGGVVAVEFDRARDAVRVQAASASRWITMRKATIVAMALPRMEHGAIDWTHVSMTENQKAREAEAMVTDILEVAQLGRSGKLEATR